MRRDSQPLAAERRRDWLLAATVLISSWLLFQVQPMAGKRILPWFGGGPAVWATAMLFFQAALLVGYLYAHLLVTLLRPRGQAIVHAALLAGAALLLAVNGVIAGDAWKPSGSDSPQRHVLAILAATVGLPYVMLAATAPLVQAWWARRHDAGSPYRLYALSNFGSLAGLLSYPLVVEPAMGLGVQGIVWSVLFGVFAVLCATSALRSQLPLPVGEGRGEGKRAKKRRPHPALSRRERVLIEPPSTAEAAPTKPRWVLWLALPACASALLLAVTNYLCQDVASLPLLWVAPLGVYLVTFIIAFDADRWYRRWFWLPGLAAASFAAAWTWQPGLNLSLQTQVGAHLALLFTAGMACHGEVARLRPAPQRLTAFYLCLSAGGVLGGLLVAVVAPLALADFYELPIATVAAWALAMCVVGADEKSALYRRRQWGVWILIAECWATLAVLTVQPYRLSQDNVASGRNFFGVLKVQDRESAGEPCRVLFHGRISHGAQFLDPSRRRDKTTYYTANTGIGQLLASLPQDVPRRVGVVGLGAGCLAAFGETGDAYRFYDIDPQVIAFAERHFTYLADARERSVEVTIVEGDARLTLEREPPQEFDVLVVDAFSGDAIPVHLLTLEAFEVYLRHVREPDGALAVHVSNRHLDLPPVVQTAAQRLGLEAWLVFSPPDSKSAGDFARWVLMIRQGSSGDAPTEQPHPVEGAPAATVWTDDYSSIWSVLREK
jgi:hypothetical protein